MKQIKLSDIIKDVLGLITQILGWILYFVAIGFGMWYFIRHLI